MTGTRKEGVCVALPSSCPAPPGCATDLKIKEWSRESSKIRSNQNCFSVCSKMPGFQDYSVQFSSVTQSCPTLYDPMNRSVPGLPDHHQLPESTQTHVHCVGDAIQPSHPVVPFSCPQSFPASGSFQMSQLSTSGGQSIGISASTSVPPMNTQDCFPLGWTGSISLQSKVFSRVFSNTTVQKHQFFCIQLSL